MTTTYDENGNEITTPPESSVITELRRKLREAEGAAQGQTAATARAETAERRLAILTAGVDPAKPGADWFVKGYDGEMTPEAIKKAAGDAGLLAGQPAAQPTGQQQEQAAVQQAAAAGYAAGFGQIDTASAGAHGGVTPVNHLENMQRALQRGGLEAMADYMRGQGLPVVGDDQ